MGIELLAEISKLKKSIDKLTKEIGSIKAINRMKIFRLKSFKTYYIH